jgi:ankyrin repeat protein
MYPTPLVYAIYHHQINIVQYLIDCGADPRKPIGSWHPIHWAVAVRSFEILEFLLDLVPDECNVPTQNGGTPLHFAAATGDARLLTLLLSYGADPNKANSGRHTPLHIVAGDTNPALAEILLAFGAELGVSDRDGKKPPAIAQDNERTKMTLFLARVASRKVEIPTREQITKKYLPAREVAGIPIKLEGPDTVLDRLIAFADDGW